MRKSHRVLIMLYFLWAFPAGVCATPLEEVWASRYDGPSQGHDSARAIALDGDGNVYITGESEVGSADSRSATVKYDAAGRRLWAAHREGAFAAIAVNSRGHTHVAGRSGDGTSCLTVKYDARGSELWEARLDGGSARAIAVDQAGNVHVTGAAASSTGSHFATMKYSPDGTLLWLSRYNGPGEERYERSEDRARGLLLDAVGNVYVTGESHSLAADFDFATIKYDSDGRELWVARFNASGSSRDLPRAIALDGAGNLFVTGSTSNLEARSGNLLEDFVTVKYDPYGNQLWVAQYGGAEESLDVATAIALDAGGGIFVAGISQREGQAEYVAVKYDPRGKELWAARQEGVASESSGNLLEDFSVAISLDRAGHAHLAASARYSAQAQSDYLVLKYDAEGNLLWRERYDGPGKGDDFVRGMAVGAGGEVHITGESLGEGTSADFATLKYDAGGHPLWTARYDGPGIAEDTVGALARDGQGNVYVTGASRAASTAEDYATVRYDPEGRELWVARFNGPGNGYDYARGLAVDGAGFVYVTGQSLGRSTWIDYATLKYDAEGNLLWEARYDHAGQGDHAMALALDQDGNVLVAGFSEAPGSGSDYATVKYDPEGNQLWIARYDGPGHQGECLRTMAVDGAGSVYITGTSAGLNGERDTSDFLTVKYDREGRQLWVSRYNGTASGHECVGGMALDRDGNVYVTGSSQGSGKGYDFVTVKYDPLGNESWVARYDGPAGGADQASAVAVDRLGNVYVTGSSAGDAMDDHAFATVKYDRGGGLLWVARYDGPGQSPDFARAVALDLSGKVFVSGQSFLSSRDSEYAVLCYDPEGRLLGMARSQGPAGGLNAVPAIVPGEAAEVILAGSASGAEDLHDYVTLKYSAAPFLFLRGDWDGDGRRALTDAVAGLNFLFLAGAEPPCSKAADSDDSGTLELTDPVSLLRFLFLGSQAPPEPFTACGADPTEDGLGCRSYLPCE